MKGRHCEKRLRDRKKQVEKMFKKVDAFVLTKDAVDLANKNSVSLEDIKHTLKKGKVERACSEILHVSSGNIVVVVSKNEKNKKEKTPSHLVVHTAWRTWRKKGDAEKLKENHLQLTQQWS